MPAAQDALNKAIALLDNRQDAPDPCNSAAGALPADPERATELIHEAVEQIRLALRAIKAK